jgi:hypothetical protein
MIKGIILNNYKFALNKFHLLISQIIILILNEKTINNFYQLFQNFVINSHLLCK